jgi:two-component system heavy metal sensor histidine kinase CusS
MSSEKTPDPTVERAGPVRRWSLAVRLTVWYSLSAFVLVVGATSFLYWALTTNLDREDDELLLDKVAMFRDMLREHPGDSEEIKAEIARESGRRQNGQLYVRVLGPSGTVRLETTGMSEELPLDEVNLLIHDNTHERGIEFTTRRGRSFRVLRSSLDADSPTVIDVALDRTYEEDLLAAYRRYLWIALALALVLCSLAGYQLARRGLRPIAEITATARRIRSTHLDERIRAAGLPQELHELAVKFNEMLDRLEDSFQRLARFSADIAHELRTPVNNLKGEAEVALTRPRSADEYREVLGSCLEECGRLSRLIDSLLFLARAENPQTQIAKAAVDVGKELTTIREFYEAAAQEVGITLAAKSQPGVMANLDRSLFQQALGNLVVNALAHTKAGGSINLTASANGEGAVVEVSDTGSGIAKEHLPYVCDRFYRADPARWSGSTGSGLGLAIVRSIVQLHQGAVAIDSEVGRGTTVRLTFPRHHCDGDST